MNFEDLEVGIIFLYLLTHTTFEDEITVGLKISLDKIEDLHFNLSQKYIDIPITKTWYPSDLLNIDALKILKILQNYKDYSTKDFKEEFPEYMI